MRTTLAIDDDILIAAKALARQQRKSIGQVVSDLARRSLRPVQSPVARNGIPLLPVTNPSAVVTTDIVNALHDELP